MLGEIPQGRTGQPGRTGGTGRGPNLCLVAYCIVLCFQGRFTVDDGREPGMKTTAPLWLHKAAPHVSLKRSSAPTVAQILSHPVETHPHHGWDVGEQTAQCTRCRLKLRASMPKQQIRHCAAQPCLGSGVPIVPVSHPSHSLHQRGCKSVPCVEAQTPHPPF